jgi:hypothetical protein
MLILRLVIEPLYKHYSSRDSDWLRAVPRDRSSRIGSVKNFFIVAGPALGPTQPPNQWVPEALCPWVKRLGRESDDSLLFSAEVKNDGATSSLLLTSSWRGAELIKHRDVSVLAIQSGPVEVKVSERDVPQLTCIYCRS